MILDKLKSSTLKCQWFVGGLLAGGLMMFIAMYCVNFEKIQDIQVDALKNDAAWIDREGSIRWRSNNKQVTKQLIGY